MNRQQQEYLIAAFIDGSASDTQLRELRTALHEDPELRQSLSDMLLINQHLYDYHDQNSGPAFKDEIMLRLRNADSGRRFTRSTLDRLSQQNEQHKRRKTRSRTRQRQQHKHSEWMWIAAIAAVLLITLAAWPATPAPVQTESRPEALTHIEQSPVIESIGTWTLVHGTDLEHPADASSRSNRCFIGDHLHASMDSSLELDDASVISIATGSHIEIRRHNNERIIYLHSGKLTAKITKQAPDRQLLFQTSHGMSKIVGTEFSLRQLGDHSRLDVLEGRIAQTNTSSKEIAFVDAGYYVEIIPHQQLEVKAINPDTAVLPAPPVKAVIAPEPVPEAQAVEAPFYEWRISKALSAQWVHGQYLQLDQDACVRSEATIYGHMIYVRIERDQRQPLRPSDRLHLQLRSDSSAVITAEIYLADQNPATPSHLQFGTASMRATAAPGFSTHVLTLNDFTFTDEALLPKNSGCFALQLSSATPFALKQALIERRKKIDSTNSEDSNIKDMNIKEKNIKETNIKETNIKETKKDH